MGNIIDALFKYYSDGNVSLSSKMKLSILAFLILALIDNHYGFSHTVINSYKVDYMMKLESAKKQYRDDAAFVKEVDELIAIEHNRKGIIEKFYSLISPRINEKETHCVDNVYNKIIAERDPIVHKLTGSFIPLMPMFSGIIVFLISLFRPSKRSLDILFLATIIVLVSACLTYYVSLAWALIDPIYGHLWINYTIQAIVNFIILVLFVAHLEAYGHKVDNVDK